MKEQCGNILEKEYFLSVFYFSYDYKWWRISLLQEGALWSST